MSASDLIRRRVIRAIKSHKAPTRTTPMAPSSSLTHTAIRRAMSDARALPAGDVLNLQRMLGNSRVSQMLQGAGGQKSGMTVGTANDRCEQQANHVAAQVTSAGQNSVQRAVEVGSEGGRVSGDLQQRIAHAKGGSPAPEGVRRKMEQQTGADFSDVRVHHDREADGISKQLGAKAATHGNHIFLAREQSPNDARLMAHELTHTIQQGAAKNGIGQTQSSIPAGVPSIQREDEDEKKIKKLNKKISGSKAKRGLAKAGKFLLGGLDRLTTAPLRLLDQASVLDLHLKDFGNFVKTGKTREQRAGNDVSTGKYKEGTKRRMNGRTGLRAMLSGVNVHTSDLNPFLPWHGKLNPFLAMGKGQVATRNLAKGYGKDIDKLRGQKQGIRDKMANTMLDNDQGITDDEVISEDLISTLVEEDELSN